MIGSGAFSPDEPQLFAPVLNSLFSENERFMVFADFRAYIDCQKRVDATYRNPDEWTRRSILNTARMGYFSSDRTILEYATDIWNVNPLESVE